MLFQLGLWLALLLGVHADDRPQEKVLATPRSYRVGEVLPVECLNRTWDTGEHV